MPQHTPDAQRKKQIREYVERHMARDTDKILRKGRTDEEKKMKKEWDDWESGVRKEPPTGYRTGRAEQYPSLLFPKGRARGDVTKIGAGEKIGEQVGLGAGITGVGMASALTGGSPAAVMGKAALGSGVGDVVGRKVGKWAGRGVDRAVDYAKGLFGLGSTREVPHREGQREQDRVKKRETTTRGRKHIKARESYRKKQDNKRKRKQFWSKLTGRGREAETAY